MVAWIQSFLVGPKLWAFWAPQHQCISTLPDTEPIHAIHSVSWKVGVISPKKVPLHWDEFKTLSDTPDKTSRLHRISCKFQPVEFLHFDNASPTQVSKPSRIEMDAVGEQSPIGHPTNIQFMNLHCINCITNLLRSLSIWGSDARNRSPAAQLTSSHHPTWQTWILGIKRTKRKVCHLPQHTTYYLGGFGSSKKWSKKVGPRNLRSILVKLSRKSSQHMQKTPGSSPCIRQCNSGSQRLSFQQSCSNDKFPADSRPLAFPCFSNLLGPNPAKLKTLVQPPPWVQSYHTMCFGPRDSAASPKSTTCGIAVQCCNHNLTGAYWHIYCIAHIAHCLLHMLHIHLDFHYSNWCLHKNIIHKHRCTLNSQCTPLPPGVIYDRYQVQ